jgi:hypothetical protein
MRRCDPQFSAVPKERRFICCCYPQAVRTAAAAGDQQLTNRLAISSFIDHMHRFSKTSETLFAERLRGIL